MTAYPSIGSYDLVVTNLSRFILAPQFVGGSPILTRQKQILGYSGGYSVVYPISVNGKKMALRCWIKDPGDVKERYARVKKHLQSNPTSYLVDFDYVDKGISVDGHKYPISYMEWIEGKTLSQFVDENITNPNIIVTMADRFLIMVKELHSKSISHGDLQDGNIIVTQNSSTIDLKLVDYDCIYAPTLQNWNNQDDLQGVPDYQHPKRYKKSNEKADYFSELVIYLSLLAYAEKPSLWKKGQEKRLLFTVEDFRNSSASVTFRTLETLSPKVKSLANKLKEFCLESDTNRLKPLEQVISSNSRSGSRNDFENAFGSPTPHPQPVTSSSATPSQSTSQIFSQSFPSASQHLTRNVTPGTFPASQPKKVSSLAPMAIITIVIVIILGLLALGAVVVSAINTQNAQATQTAIAQNITATSRAKPYYSQTFTSAPEWEWDDGDGTGFTVENGKIKGKAKGQIVAWTFAGQFFSNMKIDVDIRKINGTDNNQIGVVCNATDTRHFYAFVIGTDQTYIIWRQDGDDSATLTEWTTSSIINGGVESNHLTVICNDGNLTFSVNGVELVSVYDTTYTQGDVGIITGSFEENTNVSAYFDNFNVSNP